MTEQEEEKRKIDREAKFMLSEVENSPFFRLNKLSCVWSFSYFSEALLSFVECSMVYALNSV